MVAIINMLQLRKGGDGARGDDASNLKKEVVNWLVDLYAPILPPISPGLKSDRGLDHDVTGSLLSPVEYNWNDVEYVFLFLYTYCTDHCQSTEKYS